MLEVLRGGRFSLGGGAYIYADSEFEVLGRREAGGSLWWSHIGLILESMEADGFVLVSGGKGVSLFGNRDGCDSDLQLAPFGTG